MSEPMEETTITLSATQIVGANLISSIAVDVTERLTHSVMADYNERYIDKGPQWGEHINYSDGGHHAQTHRNKI